MPNFQVKLPVHVDDSYDPFYLEKQVKKKVILCHFLFLEKSLTTNLLKYRKRQGFFSLSKFTKLFLWYITMYQPLEL